MLSNVFPYLYIHVHTGRDHCESLCEVHMVWICITGIKGVFSLPSPLNLYMLRRCFVDKCSHVMKKNTVMWYW